MIINDEIFSLNFGILTTHHHQTQHCMLVFQELKQAKFPSMLMFMLTLTLGVTSIFAITWGEPDGNTHKNVGVIEAKFFPTSFSQYVPEH
jgi:hypothetical protein